MFKDNGSHVIVYGRILQEKVYQNCPCLGSTPWSDLVGIRNAGACTFKKPSNFNELTSQFEKNTLNFGNFM